MRKCNAYGCENCSGFVKGQQDSGSIWVLCANCFHTEQVHDKPPAEDAKPEVDKTK